MQTSNTRNWWLSASLFMALIAVLYLYPFVFDPGRVIMPASNLGTDLLTHRWADAQAFIRGVQRFGQFPLWDSNILIGQPTIGNPAIIEYYPAWWLFLLLPKAQAFNLIHWLHVWLGGLGMLALLRIGYKTTRGAAILGAIAFMLAPKYTGHLAAGHFDMTFPAYWLPFSMLCITLALERRKAYWAVLAGVPLVLGYLLHIQTFFFDVFYVSLYLVWRLLRDWHGWRSALKQMVLSALVPLSVVSFSAAQLLPWLTLLPYATRQQWSLADGNWFALPPSLLGGLLFMPRTQFPEWTMYLGVLPIALCLVAAFRSRQRDKLFLVGFLIFSIIFSLGSATPLYTLMFQYVPGFGLLRVPPRMMFIGAFVVAILTGLGWDALTTPETRLWLRRVLPLTAWFCGVMLVFLIGGYSLLFHSIPVHFIRTGLLICLILGLVGLLIKRGLLLTKTVRTLAATFAVFILLIDLLPTGWHFIIPETQSQALPPNPALDYIQAQQSSSTLFRAYALTGGLPYEQAAERDIQLLDGQQSFQLATMAVLANYAAGCEYEGFSAGMPACVTGEAGPNAARHTHPNASLLGLLNIRWLAADFPLKVEGIEPLGKYGELFLYENKQVLPRAFVVGTVQIASDNHAVLTALSHNDVHQIAYTVGGTPLQGKSGEVTITAYKANSISLNAKTTEPGMLVISEAWAEGWQATDNGKPVSVERVDVGLRGVRLIDGGEHRIELFYAPPMFVPGLLITVGALVVLGVWTLLRWRQH